MEQSRGVVLFGDVVGSRDGPALATGWLGGLRRSLDATYGHQRLAAFEFTQGDEIQAIDADRIIPGPMRRKIPKKDWGGSITSSGWNS